MKGPVFFRLPCCAAGVGKTVRKESGFFHKRRYFFVELIRLYLRMRIGSTAACDADTGRAGCAERKGKSRKERSSERKTAEEKYGKDFTEG